MVGISVFHYAVLSPGCCRLVGCGIDFNRNVRRTVVEEEEADEQEEEEGVERVGYQVVALYSGDGDGDAFEKFGGDF